MAGLAYIGPVRVELHGEPSFKWTSSLDPAGTRRASIAGVFDEAVAEQLSELLADTDAAPTTGGVKGVVAPIWAEGRFLDQFIGWYLLESFDIDPDHAASLTAEAKGTLAATYLGDGVEAVIARAAAVAGNVYGVSPKSLVVSPFRPEDDAGDRFVVDPGGAFATREFDPSSPHDGLVSTPADGTARLGFYAGALTSSSDAIADVAFPRVSLRKDTPAWIAQQGGAVRAYDRRARREVFGPHPFRESTDLAITNGITRAWVGNRGLVPFLNVEAVTGGAWRQVGVIQLGDSAPLLRARLSYITAELVVVALTIDGYGDALVALRRGERMFRVVSPSSSIRPTWTGTPPVSHVTQAGNAAGRYGNGLDGRDVDGVRPDLRLLRPALTEWGDELSWRPGAASGAIGDAGLLVLLDADAAIAGVVWFEASSSTIRFEVAGQTIYAPVAFAAGDDLTVAARFSPAEGMALTVRLDDGTFAAAANPAYTTAPPAVIEHGYFANFTAWGDGSWGDGVWGGVTLYPKGTIDNHMILDGWPTENRVRAIADSATPLGGLGVDEASLVWLAPFDAAPIVTLGALSSGRRVDPVVDADGFQRVIGFLDELRSGAYLATSGALDGVADQHGQLAADSDQGLRVRAR